MNNKRFFTSCLCSLAFISSVWAESQDVIKGRVADANGKPVAGVLVNVKGTSTQALTNAQGEFNLKGKVGDKLDFVHPDFYYQETSYEGKSQLLVQLDYRVLPVISKNHTEKTPLLRGELSKDKNVETIGFIGGSQLSTSPTYNFLGAAQGRLAGLDINFAQGGSMAANYNWNVRNARQTLFLVDGIQRDFYTMDPDQIESIQVLKDGLSTVMLGQRSSAGVVNIITKKGDGGSLTPRISFTANVGFEKALKLPKLLGAADYMELANEAYENDGLTPQYSQDLIQSYRNHTNDPFLSPDVDWYKQNLEKTTPLYRYNLNISGASRSFRYFVDVDWFRENGFLKTDDKNSYNTNAQTNRFNIRSNLGVQVTPTTYVQVNLMGRQERYNEPGGGMNAIYQGMLSTRPNQYPVYNPDGTYGSFQQGGGNGNLYGQVIDRGYKFTDYRNVAFDLSLNQRLDFLLKGLYVEVLGSYASYTVYNTDHNKPFVAYWYHEDDVTKEPVYQQIGADGDQANGGSKGVKRRTTYLKGTIGYEHNFGKHHVAALAVADLNQIQEYASYNGYLQNFTNYSARVNYDYDNRYVVEGVYTHGGYNWLAPSKRWSDYYGFGAAWNAHNESFIKALGVFDTFKLRGTYALTGMATANYAEYIPQHINDGNNFWTAPYQSKTTYEGTLPSYLEPEKARKWDVGIDLGFLNNRLTATFDYYHNKYTGVVANTEVTTALVGAKFPRINCQEYSYKGYETTVTWQDHVRNFNYYVTGNITFNQTNFDYAPQLPKAYPWMSQLGLPVGMTYGYVADGIFQSQEEIDNYPAFLENAIKSTIRPGDIRYKDLNEDGVINQYDKKNLGSKKYKGYYGLTLGGNYKGFDFSVHFQGTINRQSYISGNFMTGSGSNGADNLPIAMTSYVLNRWTPENHSNTHTRLWYGNYLGANTNNNQTSSFWIHNSDYFRLKNVEIGYTLPTRLTRKIGIPSVRVFANGMNLWTTSELYDVRDDVDPESWGSNYPMTRTFNFGVSIKL